MIDSPDQCGVMNSELSLKVLHKIANEEKGDYGSRIADKLDKSQSSIGRTLGELKDLNFIEKGDRERAQYYEINYEGMANYWFNRVVSELEKTKGGINRKKYLEKGYTTKEEMLEGMNNHEEEIEELVADYLENVLTSNVRLEKMTVSELLFESLGHSISHNWIQDEELLEKHPYLEQPIDALVFIWNMDGYPIQLNEAINEKE